MVAKLKAAAHQRLIQKWYRKWSVWLTGVAGAVAFIPADTQIMAMLPADWYRYAFIAILLARIVKQGDKNGVGDK
jgi:hypothetical protein